MTDDSAIRDRFLSCIAEVARNSSVGKVAKTIGTTGSYLSQLKTITKPKISSLLIANFCFEYNYSADFILTGRGKRMNLAQMSKDEKLIEIIGDLLNALLELKPKWNTATQELIDNVKKRQQ